jgi:hypothetical protein
MPGTLTLRPNVGLDIGLGLGLGDAQLVGQAEGRDAVDDAEIDRLGLAPDHGVHALDRDVEDLGGGDRVDVLAVQEGLAQGLHLGDVGGQAKLDLAVVQADQLHAFLGHEGATDLAALLGPHRDVLQVGVVGGQPPRRGHRLTVGGVDPPGLGIDLLLQGVGVGALELGELAPVEHLGRQLVALGG